MTDDVIHHTALAGDIDWELLRQRANSIAPSAYAPYSRYQVGAAGLTDDGRVVVGCNVENAAYGSVLCAECGLVSQLVATGGGRLLACVVVNSEGELIMPCGRCRQILWEHGGRSLLLWTPLGIQTMNEVLPQAFDAQDLDEVLGATSQDGGLPPARLP